MSAPQRLRPILLTAAAWLLPAALALAQNADAPGPVGGAPATLPELKLPDAASLGVSVPRQVRAAQAVLGMGRQRLALVVGIGTVGSRRVVDSAQRDTQAVAAALRDGGFVVMLREDLSSTDLRSVLKEFRERLQPGGVGIAYVTGLGVQVDGQTVLLTRDAPLDGAAPVAQLAPRLRASGVPMSELVDALTGTADSPRLLVVDAAYRHPALEGLPVVGLAEPRLPPGLMALYGLPPGNAQEVPAVAPLPVPPPTDAREIAASPFARALVASLLKPRINGPEALRSTRRAIVDATLGLTSPWIGGDTDGREELAEATLLDGLVPRTPEELAREGLRQASRVIRRGGAAAGEQSVAEVLQQTAQPADNVARPPADAGRALPQTPGGPGTLASSAGSVASSTASALGTAAGVAGTVASVAGTAATLATVAVAAQAVTAGTAASVAGTAVGAAGSVVGNAVALGSRLLGSGGEGSAAAGAAGATAAPTQGVASRLSATAAAAEGAARLPADSSAARQAMQGANALQAQAVPAAQAAQAVQATQTAQAAQAVQGALAVQTLQAAQATSNLVAPPALAEQLAAAAAQASVANPSPASAAPVAAQASSSAPAPPSAGPAAPDGRTLRNNEGGERPVYAPRMNAYGYAEGDTYTYRLMDTWKGEVVNEYTTAIEEVLDSGEMLANGQRLAMDAQGRITRQTAADGSYSEFVPRQELWWSRPQRGQSRDIQFQENFKRPDGVLGQTEWRGSTDVGRAEKIATPAGEFEVLPMESSGWWTETLANGTRVQGKWSRTVYYSTKLGHPVAIDIQDTDALGRLLKRERVELLHAQSRRGAP